MYAYTQQEMIKLSFSLTYFSVQSRFFSPNPINFIISHTTTALYSPKQNSRQKDHRRFCLFKNTKYGKGYLNKFSQQGLSFHIE